MTVRRDIWHERLVEHLQEREWSDVQIINLTHKIGHSALMSHEGVLEVLEYQQSIDEQIQAEKDFDKTYHPTLFDQTRVDL
jgi:hypothetical protein